MKSRKIFASLLLAALSTSCNSGGDSGSSASGFLGGSSSIARPTNLDQPNSVCIKDSISLIALAGTINIGGSDTISGDIVALDNSSVQIGGSVHINGTVYLDSGAQAHQGGADTITGNIVQSDVSTDQALITDFITSLTSLTATQSFDEINLNTTIESTGALNVISINDLALYGSQRLTLNGGASDIFILNVSGNVSTGGSSGIFLSGGLKPVNVIINNLGSGADVQIGGSDEVNGTIIAYNRGINVGGSDTIRGALVAGNGINIGGSNGVWSPQGFCGVTAPAPGPTPSPSPSPCADLVCPTGPLSGGGVTGI
jgi:hypothetical protein